MNCFKIVITLEDILNAGSCEAEERSVFGRMRGKLYLHVNNNIWYLHFNMCIYLNYI